MVQSQRRSTKAIKNQKKIKKDKDKDKDKNLNTKVKVKDHNHHRKTFSNRTMF